MATGWTFRLNARVNGIIWNWILDECVFGMIGIRCSGCSIAAAILTATDCMLCDCFNWSQLKCVCGCEGRCFVDWFELGNANGVFWNIVLFQWGLDIIFMTICVDAVNVIYVVFGCQFIWQFTQ